jgi:hypothetical protein
MKFEKTQDEAFLGRWKYRAQYSYTYNNGKQKKDYWKTPEEKAAIEAIETFLRKRSTGGWLRQGNCFYVDTLEDIFHLRLFFENNLKTIKEAQAAKAVSSSVI